MVDTGRNQVSCCCGQRTKSGRAAMKQAAEEIRSFDTGTVGAPERQAAGSRGSGLGGPTPGLDTRRSAG